MPEGVPRSRAPHLPGEGAPPSEAGGVWELCCAGRAALRHIDPGKAALWSWVLEPHEP